VLERKDCKAKELQEQRQRDVSAKRQREVEREIAAKLEELAVEKGQVTSTLRQYEAQFAEGDPWLRCFKRHIERGRLNAVVEVSGTACPGCHVGSRLVVVRN